MFIVATAERRSARRGNAEIMMQEIAAGLKKPSRYRHFSLNEIRSPRINGRTGFQNWAEDILAGGRLIDGRIRPDIVSRFDNLDQLPAPDIHIVRLPISHGPARPAEITPGMRTSNIQSSGRLP